MKKEKTFSVTYRKSESATAPFGYIFSWHDGEKETFIPVSLHGALALASHFDSIGYLDMVHIAPTHHEYVELNYKENIKRSMRNILAD
tara:strand:- start:738 stop:1001 length:264 start_codon:yes stop_codon:yes gene_type:complete